MWGRSNNSRLLKSKGLIRFVFFVFFNLCKAGFHLISRYAGRNVTAVVGSSLDFSWTFKGDSFISIDFGFLISLNAVVVQDKNKPLFDAII